MIAVDQIRTSLTGPLELHPGTPEDAAVAMVLAGDNDRLEVCFIRRAQRSGDRWSGHLAFPGGRPEPGDRHLRDTAEREAEEELGLTLRQAEHLGSLPAVPINGIGGGGQLSSFVYYLGPENAPLVPDEREVAAAFWTPIDGLMATDRRTSMPWRGLQFPGIRLGEDVLWGLTLRVWQLWCEQVGIDLDLRWPIPAHTR